jgi:hypothetical protein
MSSPPQVGNNRVHSYGIELGSSSYSTLERLEDNVVQRSLKRILNKVDGLYSWSQDKSRLFVEVFQSLAESALLNYDSTVLVIGPKNTGITFLLEGTSVLERKNTCNTY